LDQLSQLSHWSQLKPIERQMRQETYFFYRTDFLAGQYFDIRLEVHAPLNGSEANGGIPDPNFSFTVQKTGGAAQTAASYFKIAEPTLETWNFTWFEDLFLQDAKKPTVVRVTSKAYRRVALYEPGEYVATLKYYNGTTTVANWIVRPLAQQKRAKNVILFIGDGMTTNMITAARLIGHKSINGKYQTTMALDKFPVLGHQMVCLVLFGMSCTHLTILDPLFGLIHH
jgi:hypothetical protein